MVDLVQQVFSILHGRTEVKHLHRVTVHTFTLQRDLLQQKQQVKNRAEREK